MRLLGEIAWTEGSDVVIADRRTASRWPGADAWISDVLETRQSFHDRRGRVWRVGDSAFLTWFGSGDNPVQVWRSDPRTIVLQQCFLDQYGDPEREAELLLALAVRDTPTTDPIGTITVAVNDVLAFPAVIDWAEIQDQIVLGSDGVTLDSSIGQRDGGVQFQLPTGTYACSATTFRWQDCEVERAIVRPI